MRDFEVRREQSRAASRRCLEDLGVTLPAPQTPTENPTDRESAGGVPARGKVSVSWEGDWSICLAFCLVAPAPVWSTSFCPLQMFL